MSDEKYFIKNSSLYMRNSYGGYNEIVMPNPRSSYGKYRVSEVHKLRNGGWCLKEEFSNNEALLDDDGNIIIDFSEECGLVRILGEGIASGKKLVGTYHVGCIVQTYDGSVRAPMIGAGVPQGIYRTGLKDIKTKDWIIKPENSIFESVYSFENGYAFFLTMMKR